jgi:hypothetical protein
MLTATSIEALIARAPAHRPGTQRFGPSPYHYIPTLYVALIFLILFSISLCAILLSCSPGSRSLTVRMQWDISAKVSDTACGGLVQRYAPLEFLKSLVGAGDYGRTIPRVSSSRFRCSMFLFFVCCETRVANAVLTRCE